MAVVINTNVDSIKIQNILSTSTTRMSQSMQRMSTGLKINSAKDDAAGTKISARMVVQLNGNKVAQTNVQSASAMLATAEGNLDTIQNNLSRIRDLTLQAKNGTYDSTEIQALQDEVKQRLDEINRISDNSKYSQLSLFEDVDGLQTNGSMFQVGANGSKDNTIEADSSIFKSVKFSLITGIKEYDLTKITNQQKQGGETTPTVDNPEAVTSFETAIECLDAGIENITQRKSVIGSVGNRLDSAYETLTTQYENLSSAKSIITDTDVASEASRFTQNQILQQVSTSLLAQANQAPSIALSLI